MCIPSNGGDHEAAANADAANEVYKVWECYVAGLSPTNEAAAFKVKAISFENGEPVVEWEPELVPDEAAKRLYTVYGKVRISDSGWSPVDGEASAYNFFRVTVEMR